jgi:uncharacterized membrane protein
MTTVAGIFDSLEEAEAAVQTLKSHGISDGQINVLARGESSFPVHAKQAGGAIGGALGLGAVTLLPGLGPVIGLGMLASGLIGVALGAAAGAAVDRHTHGVPNEDLFFFEETIRNGGAVVIIETRDATQETQGRNLIERAGGRAAHVVRRDWWQGRRHQEGDYLRSRGYELEPVESDYRSGFEAALHPTTRGRAYEQVVSYVETCYPGPCRTAAFRVGYDRGQEYFRDRVQARELE